MVLKIHLHSTILENPDVDLGQEQMKDRKVYVCARVTSANITTMFPVINSWGVLKHFSLTADHVTIWIWRLCSLSTYMVWFTLIIINEAILHECGQLRHMSMVDAPTVASLVEADLAWSDEHLGCFWNWAICFLFLWVALPLWATAVVMAIQWVTASLRVSVQSACQPLRYVWAWGDPGDSEPSLLSSPHLLLNTASFPCPCYSAPGSSLQTPRCFRQNVLF